MTDGEYFKIGKSCDPIKREKDFLISNLNVKLLCWGIGISESFLHQRYIQNKINGEWFYFDEKQINEISNLIKGVVSDVEKRPYNYNISITKNIQIVWIIKNNISYGFGKDKNLYNLKTGRKIKQTLNNRSVGYWIGKKFYSVSFLKQNDMLVRPKFFDVPF
jgi:hypothetical protein